MLLHSFLRVIFGDPSEKRLKSYQKEFRKIAEFESLFASITTISEIQSEMMRIRAQFTGLNYKDPEELKAIRALTNTVKYEVFALHRRASNLLMGTEYTLADGSMARWNMIPYDVQMLGAIALIDGNIAEMRTGEGKTFVATIAASLAAVAGYPVHIVTVNDYLAGRDRAEMRPIYEALGFTTGVIVHSQNPEEKRQNYAANIVYATNNELGFDYLRDNMVSAIERRVMGPLYFAIVDEVDSILVDEARTPLIISAPDSEPTSKYLKFAAIAKSLSEGTHYKIDEKQKTATLVEAGITELEKILGVENIYASDNYNDIHHIENAIKAQFVYRSDVDYLVRGQEVLIIDEHTGRVLSGRRYSDGLHQAIEAKERVEIQQETRTLASITFQNYFRLYSRLAGMTGTAKTEEEEFYKIYRLEVITVPTNRPMIRQDLSDLLFKNETGKYTYLVELLGALQAKGQPVLVGTVSVAKSEYLSTLLTSAGIPHQVLNAKQDAREAEIIGQAGQFGAITIATNMAGRGTDIKIAPEVAALKWTVEIASVSDPSITQKYELGGLYVIGTEKHETRRIDNQLRGRSGRQGDPGLSQFLVAPTDDIMRIFGGDKLFGIFNSPMFASIPDREPLAKSGLLTSRITGVQKQVEGRNFDIRKHILEYDDVLNQHRLVAYARRNRLLEGDDAHAGVIEAFTRIAASLVERARNSEWEDFGANVIQEVNTFAEKELLTTEDLTSLDEEDLAEIIQKVLLTAVEKIVHSSKEAEFKDFERRLQLSSIDELWMAHIDRMAHLREEVAFEWYAQKQPLVVYKERAYERFTELMYDIDYKIVKSLLTIEAIVPIREHEIPVETMIIWSTPIWSELEVNATNPLLATRDTEWIRVMRAEPTASSSAQYTGVGRNDPCPCGSGKKFKHCHGK